MLPTGPCETTQINGVGNATFTPACGFERLPAAAALGHAETVRRAIDRLLEPVASTNAALLFASLAHVWQAAGGFGTAPLLWLLSPYSGKALLSSYYCQ